MRTVEMAREYVRRAEATLEEARRTFKKGDNPLTVRRSQEAVELSLKAVLRFLGIEYPREHDVRDALLEAAASRPMPEWFKAEIEFMASASSDLARKRGPAFYGDEQAMLPPSSLFAEQDARKALQDAERTYRNCERLIRSA